MELHAVDAVAVPVVSVEHGRVAVGLDPPAQRLAAHDLTELAQSVEAPRAALALDALDQRVVLLEEVVALEGRGLVEDLMRVGGPSSVDDGHADEGTPAA